MAQFTKKVSDKDSIIAMAVLPNGDLITGISGFTGTFGLLVWRLKGASLSRRHIAAELGLQFVQVLALRNGHVACGTKNEGLFFIIDPADGSVQVRAEVEIHATSMAELDDGSIAYASHYAYAENIFVLERATGREKCQLCGHKSSLEHVVALAGGSLASSSFRNADVIVWDVAACAPRHVLQHQAHEEIHLQALSNGQLLAGSASLLIVWDPQSGGQLFRKELSEAAPGMDNRLAAVSQLATCTGGDHLLLAMTHANDILLVSLEDGSTKRTLKDGQGRVHMLALLPDGRLVSVSQHESDGQIIKIWNV